MINSFRSGFESKKVFVQVTFERGKASCILLWIQISLGFVQKFFSVCSVLKFKTEKTSVVHFIQDQTRSRNFCLIPFLLIVHFFWAILIRPESGKKTILQKQKFQRVCLTFLVSAESWTGILSLRNNRQNTNRIFVHKNPSSYALWSKKGNQNQRKKVRKNKSLINGQALIGAKPDRGSGRSQSMK